MNKFAPLDLYFPHSPSLRGPHPFVDPNIFKLQGRLCQKIEPDIDEINPRYQTFNPQPLK